MIGQVEILRLAARRGGYAIASELVTSDQFGAEIRKLEREGAIHLADRSHYYVATITDKGRKLLAHDGGAE